MLKALALDNVFAPVFGKTKNKAIRTEGLSNFRLYVSIGLIAANAVLLMSYVYGVNEYASKGYEIKALQTKLSLLNEDNKKISLKVSESSSMVAIQSDFLNANFVAVGTPKFLTVGGNQLTQR